MLVHRNRNDEIFDAVFIDLKFGVIKTAWKKS